MNKLIAFLLLCILSACSSFTMEPPEIHLANVLFTNATLFETTLEADIRYENPNDEDLLVKSAVHRLSLNGLDIGKGFHRHDFTVPAYGSVTEKVDFRISNVSMATKGQSLIQSGRFDYAVHSRVKTNKGSFSVENEGNIIQ